MSLKYIDSLWLSSLHSFFPHSVKPAWRYNDVQIKSLSFVDPVWGRQINTVNTTDNNIRPRHLAFLVR